MTTITLPITDLRAIALFAANKDVRDYLNSVAIDNECLVATNGHYCASLPVHIPPDQLPTGVAIGEFQCIIPVDAINSFLRGLSARDKKEGDVLILISDSDSRLIKGNSAVLFTPIDARYPHWQRIMATSDDPAPTPVFNWHHMALFQKAADILSGDKHTQVSLIPHGTGIGKVFFPGQSFKGVVMPMRN